MKFTPERWQQIRCLLAEVEPLPAHQRRAVLDMRCGDDAELRTEVERLLASDDDTAGVLDRPLIAGGFNPDVVDILATPNLEGSKIGRYRIRRMIASGGMGSVYEAMQEQPRRTVALKVMKHGIASRSALRRFEYEAQILARLRHPGIAQIFEAGTHRNGSAADGGVPYFAMEYIPNAKPITEFVRERKLTTSQRLELFAKVCEAVHHGHQKGIIHRDLKPTNILVDSSGQSKVIDFGVARATDSDMAVTTLQTDIGQLIGTLQYMSPEQCNADPHDLDTRSDVYALGVVLYELICEQLPYDVSRVALHEAARLIREELPAKPSTVNRTLRGDVETIALKALAKERERRYQSAADLGEDVLRFLHSEPIEARPPSLVYQIQTFARRHKAIASAFAAIVIVLTGALAAISGYAVKTKMAEDRADRQRNVALQNAALAEKSAAESQRLRLQAEKALAEVMVARQGENEALHDTSLALLRLEREQRLKFIAAAENALNANEIASARTWLGNVTNPQRNWEWHYLNSISDTSLMTLEGHNDSVAGAAFSPDGNSILTASSDKTARLWESATGFQNTILRKHEGAVRLAIFSPGGDKILTGSYDRTVRIWDRTTGTDFALPEGHASWVRAAAFNSTGDRVVTAGHDSSVVIWNANDGRLVAKLSGHTSRVNSVRFGPDDSTVLSASADFSAIIWDVESGSIRQTLSGHEDDVVSAAFNADGTQVVTSSIDGTARIWHAATGQEMYVLLGHEADVVSAVFNPAGTRVVTASKDHSAILWNAITGRMVKILRGHTDEIRSVAFSPGTSPRIVTASLDKSARVWDGDSGAELAVLYGHEGPLTSAAFNHDGSRIVTASRDHTAKIWNAQMAPVLRNFPGQVYSAVCSPDGIRMLVSAYPQAALLLDVGTGQTIAELVGHESQLISAAFSQDGQRAMTASFNTVKVWSGVSGGEIAELMNLDVGFTAAALSRNGLRVVTACEAHSADTEAKPTVRIWDATTGNQRTVLAGHEQIIYSVTFSGDGVHFVTASKDTTARVWNLQTGIQRHVLRGHEADVRFATFSPDGQIILTVSNDATARLWHLQTGELIEVLRGHTDVITSAAFNHDGSRAVTVSNDATARVWNPATGQPIATLIGHNERLTAASFNPQGSRVVTASIDKTARVWDATDGNQLLVLRGHSKPITSAAFTPEGDRVLTTSDDQTIRVWDSVPHRVRFAQQRD